MRRHSRPIRAKGLLGRSLWLIFSRLLDGVEKDRHHARMELEYLKDEIESALAS